MQILGNVSFQLYEVNVTLLSLTQRVMETRLDYFLALYKIKSTEARLLGETWCQVRIQEGSSQGQRDARVEIVGHYGHKMMQEQNRDRIP